MISFEGMERRQNKINKVLKEFDFKNLEECEKFCLNTGINVRETVKNTQPICFENAVYAYSLGTAIALQKASLSYEETAKNIGLGLEAFCVEGSVAENRKIGIGHGNLAGKLLNG